VVIGSAALSGCRAKPADTGADEVVDEDEDGWGPDSDCDDADVSVHPHATERCDGLDDDCDGEIDEDPVDGTLYFADADGDGYGSPAYGEVLCEATDGYADTPRDCDDTNAGVSPAAAELCDGVDNDCDDTVDEPSALDATDWYHDADQDGYGNVYASALACEAPDATWVTDATDCNDGDPAISPGELELCDDAEVDEDCDGLANDDDDRVANPSFWYIDVDEDGHGDPAVPLTACAAPAGWVASGDDCDDADPWASPEAAERCADGADDDCDGLVDEDGEDLAWYVDLDGDDYGDREAAPTLSCAAVDGAVPDGADCDDGDASVHPEAAEGWYDGLDQDCDGADDYDADADGVEAEPWGADCDDGAATTAPDLPEVCGSGVDEDCDGLADPCELLYATTSRHDGDHAGGALVALADLNSDGLLELAVGSPRSSEADDDAGYVSILASAQEGEETLTRAQWQLYGADAGERAGAALAAADVDGDGADDLVVGAPGSSAGLAAAGAFYTLLSYPYDPTSLADGEGAWTGQAVGDGAGAALAGAGDVDGDGYEDLLVGAPDALDEAGAAFLVYGPTSGAHDLSWAGAFLDGVTPGDGAGEALLADVDLDGDGLLDLLVAAPLAGVDDAIVGALWLVLDPQPGAASLGDADARWWGADRDTRFGASLASAGDVDGDGLTDLLVGAPARGMGGAAWLLCGGPPASGPLDLGLATALLESARLDVSLGTALAGPGDLDGDGHGDLLLGAPGADDAGSASGAAWLLLGPASGDILVEESATARFDGADEGQRAGGALAPLPDWDGDGAPDLAVGAPASDASASTDAGLRVWSLTGF